MLTVSNALIRRVISKRMAQFKVGLFCIIEECSMRANWCSVIEKYTNDWTLLLQSKFVHYIYNNCWMNASYMRLSYSRKSIHIQPTILYTCCYVDAAQRKLTHTQSSALGHAPLRAISSKPRPWLPGFGGNISELKKKTATSDLTESASRSDDHNAAAAARRAVNSAGDYIAM